VTGGATASWMVTLTGRPAMRSPDRPPIQRDVERAFWLKIAEVLTSVLRGFLSQGTPTCRQPLPVLHLGGCVNDFVSNAGANIVGTFIGAGLALVSSWWLQRRSAVRADRRHLQGLVDRLYRSRAIAPGRSRTEGPLSELEVTDCERGTASIIATRDRTATVCDALTVLTGAIAPLERIYVHCLDYLDASTDDPSGYLEHLMELREKLQAEVDALVVVVPGLTGRELGTARRVAPSSQDRSARPL
jgi:hypothetical protein